MWNFWKRNKFTSEKKRLSRKAGRSLETYLIRQEIWSGKFSKLKWKLDTILFGT
jgi:hypothetical protein